MDGLSLHGLVPHCETCDSILDFADDGSAEAGVCRQCGIAFLVDAPPTKALGEQTG